MEGVFRQIDETAGCMPRLADCGLRSGGATEVSNRVGALVGGLSFIHPSRGHGAPVEVSLKFQTGGLVFSFSAVAGGPVCSESDDYNVYVLCESA